MTYKTIDTSTLRQNLSDALNSVSAGQTLIVSKRGKSKVAIIDIDAYEDFLAAQNPKNTQAIKEAREQYDNGETLGFDEVFGNL